MPTGARMTIYPLDAGMAEKIDSTEPSVLSCTRRWSAPEGRVGWEEEWKVGTILHYYRTWLRFRLPPLSGAVLSTLRLHLSSRMSNSGPLRVALYSLPPIQDERWSSGGRILGSVAVADNLEPAWVEIPLARDSLRMNGANLLELRAEREETGGFSTWSVAIFDLLTPGWQAEIALSR